MSHELRPVVYTYKNCSTCRNATRWLRENGIEFTEKPIRETPPSKAELQRMLEIYDGDLRRLFNTSGQDYRAQNLKDRLPLLTSEEAIDLLHQNGNLIKRPFLLTPTTGRVGWKESDWQELFNR